MTIRVSSLWTHIVKSDHRLIMAKLSLRWCHFKKSPPFPLWADLKKPDRCKDFMEKFNENLKPDSTFSSFSHAVQLASKILSRRRPHQKTALWDSDPVIARARANLQSATRLHGHDSEEALQAYQALATAHQTQAEVHTNSIVEEVQHATDNCRHSAAWRAINALTGRKSKPNTVVAADSIEHRKELMASHYKSVLNAPTPPTTTFEAPPDFIPVNSALFDTGSITEQEVQKALHPMRSDAAAGPDGIPVRVLKLPELLPTITNFLNSSCCLGGNDAAARVPSEWRTASIVSIPKKGNSTALTNQRGISLMCTSAKLLNKILLNRLLPHINPLLLQYQSGFRPGRSTTEQVAALRSIIESCKTRKMSVSIVFVDFKKAFDSVSRSSISVILRLYGVPETLNTAVMDLYGNTKASVQTNHGLTEEFETTSGVLQGDTLAPLLFILVLDYVLRHCLNEEDSFVLARRRSTRHPAIYLPALAFADDIALLCRDPQTAQRSLNRLYERAQAVGLHISGPKTEVLHIGTEGTPSLSLPSGEVIASCQDFKYLGVSVFSSDCLFADRRTQAWRAAHQLGKVFNSEALENTKLKLFKAIVEPILFYGLESVPITASREETMDASHRSLMRYALNIHYPETISSAALYQRTKILPLSTILRRRRLMLIGHCLRSSATDRQIPLCLVLQNPPTESLRRGQGRTITLLQTFTADMAAINATPSEISSMSKNLFRDRVLTL